MLKSLIYRIFKKLPIFPDNDRLILWIYKLAIKKTIKEKKFDYVIIQILPFSFLLLAKYIKEISPQSKIIFDLSDPIGINAKFNSFSKFKQRYLKRIETSSLSFSDHVIVLNEEIKKYYSKFFQSENNVTVIEQGCNKMKSASTEKRISHKYLKLLYAGRFYKGTREPFELYKGISEMEFEVRLKIYGSFNKKFRPPKTERFSYGGSISQEVLFDEYFDSDIIIFIDNDNSYQVPGKIFEILATNKPILCIIAGSNSPTLNFTQKFEGIFYAENDKSDIINAISEIKRIKKYYWRRDISQYHWSTLLNRLDKVIL